MSEPLSSNEQVLLRGYADPDQEIDRLNRMVGALIGDGMGKDGVIARLSAERDRLRAALSEIRTERNYLRGSLETIASGSLDDMPPFRAAPHDVLRKFAQKALDWPRATDETDAEHG